jgi:guanylate kinase
MCSSGETSPGGTGRGVVLVVSGPSGVGKSTIVKRLLEDPRYVLSVSATTRPRRPGEEEGREYYFLSREQFRRWIDEGKFIEHVELFENFYGTPAEPLRKAVAQGRVYVLDIDVQGAIRLRGEKLDGIYVLLEPPGMEELEKRLKGRATESPEQLRERVDHAEWELGQREYYDYCVVNDSVGRAVEQIRSVVDSRLKG